MHNLKKFRKLSNMTQIELSLILQVTNDYISRIERKNIIPSMSLAKKISDCLSLKLNRPITINEIFFESTSNTEFCTDSIISN